MQSSPIVAARKAREVLIIGAGIAGVSLARELAARPGLRVTVLDRDGDRPRGSTAFAPGFIGLYNDAPVLMDLARASAAVYAAVGAGFARAGGLELATSEAGAAEIERRSRAARAAGLVSAMRAPAGLPESVAAFVDTGRIVAAAYCGDDAVARPAVLTAALRAQAESRGARFLAGRVIALDAAGSSVAVTVSTGERFIADDVVLAAAYGAAFWPNGSAWRCRWCPSPIPMCMRPKARAWRRGRSCAGRSTTSMPACMRAAWAWAPTITGPCSWGWANWRPAPGCPGTRLSMPPSPPRSGCCTPRPASSRRGASMASSP